MSIKFSFIIPTRNEEKYIENCLSSIRRQRRNDYEIIVVDDYSTDRTIIIARKYHTRVFIKRTKGPGAARNKGAQQARGTILIFADADVIFEKNFLDLLDKKFVRSIVGGGVCALKVYDSRKSIIRASYNIANWIAWILTRLGKPMTVGSCFIFRKDVIKEVGGFNPQFITNEDHDMADRASKIKRFVFFHDITINTSSRRVEKIGLYKSIKIYFKSTLVYFLNHGYLRDYWNL